MRTRKLMAIIKANMVEHVGLDDTITTPVQLNAYEVDGQVEVRFHHTDALLTTMSHEDFYEWVIK